MTRSGWICLMFAISITTQDLRNPAQAQSGSVRAIFEYYDLLGTFAADCSQAASERNIYIVHRALDADQVQRDSMSGPTTRVDVSVIDSASASGPGELALSLANERRRLYVVVRVEPRRWRLIESTRENGEKLVSGGRTTDSAGEEMPWLNRCG